MTDGSDGEREVTDGPDRERGDRRAQRARRRRVTVAHPRTLAAIGGGQPPASGHAADDLGRQTPLGDVYLRSLMRAQLRLGLAVAGTLAAVLGGLPLLFLAVPDLRNGTAAGIPTSWLIIAVAVHPVILTLAYICVRHAGRNERDFTDMERS
ncbi:hypothetical protein [Streptomyces sp. NPDC006274]|uniref:hypothetical protein n=1 Tax=unclassified Streptomyces TaxID=2593676 RepID=UPI0033B6B651